MATAIFIIILFKTFNKGMIWEMTTLMKLTSSNSTFLKKPTMGISLKDKFSTLRLYELDG